LGEATIQCEIHKRTKGTEGLATEIGGTSKLPDLESELLGILAVHRLSPWYSLDPREPFEIQKDRKRDWEIVRKIHNKHGESRAPTGSYTDSMLPLLGAAIAELVYCAITMARGVCRQVDEEAI
jgi:hypothetical protein